MQDLEARASGRVAELQQQVSQLAHQLEETSHIRAQLEKDLEDSRAGREADRSKAMDVLVKLRNKNRVLSSEVKARMKSSQESERDLASLKSCVCDAACSRYVCVGESANK